MRTYETTFIINPQTDDATITKHVNEIADIITGNKGKILHQENMGTRRLAYEINGLNQGFYANFVYQAPQEVLPKLDRHFKLNEAYIRDLTIRYDGDPEDIFAKKDLMNRSKTDIDDGSSEDKPIVARVAESKTEEPAQEEPVEVEEPDELPNSDEEL